MTNHVHLLVTPSLAGAVSRTMQGLGRQYVGYINGRYRRTGTLWVVGYPWSSSRANAQAMPDAVVVPHGEYLKPGSECTFLTGCCWLG